MEVWLLVCLFILFSVSTYCQHLTLQVHLRYIQLATSQINSYLIRLAQWKKLLC